ncbi:hypothetical protein QAD02_022938, partial [Eretmocerus hayati]
VTAVPTTEQPDSTTENLQDEFTLNTQYPDEPVPKRQRRTFGLLEELGIPEMVMDSILELKNRLYYNRRGYKIVFQKDCPGVVPSKMSLVPKWLIDIFSGVPVKK